MQKIKKKRLEIKLILLLLAGVIFVLSNDSYIDAYENNVISNEDKNANIPQKAIDFILSIYNEKNIDISNLKSEYSVDLYDGDDNVIATAIIFKRDEQVDYVVYNHVTMSVNEYGFDCPDAYEYFEENSRMYYAGIMNYYEEKGNKIYNSDGIEINREHMRNKIDEYLDYSENRYKEIYGGSSAKYAEAGMFNWKTIKDKTSGWENTDWGYLDGIFWGSTNYEDGISGKGLAFKSMNYFALYNSGIDNHCGPTALTNIMIYYDWLGMDTLINNSAEDTFAELRKLCKHSNDNGTNISNARSALIKYLNNRGISVSLTNFKNSFSQYKKAIDNDRIVLTLLNVDDWGHFVVTLGYEEYRKTYTISLPKVGNIKQYTYLRYIRVCDGWKSCNKNRFVDLNEYYDSYNNSALVIK